MPATSLLHREGHISFVLRRLHPLCLYVTDILMHMFRVDQREYFIHYTEIRAQIWHFSSCLESWCVCWLFPSSKVDACLRENLPESQHLQVFPLQSFAPYQVSGPSPSIHWKYFGDHVASLSSWRQCAPCTLVHLSPGTSGGSAGSLIK